MMFTFVNIMNILDNQLYTSNNENIWRQRIPTLLRWRAREIILFLNIKKPMKLPYFYASSGEPGNG
jgi:hypothetical protein